MTDDLRARACRKTAQHLREIAARVEAGEISPPQCDPSDEV